MPVTNPTFRVSGLPSGVSPREAVSILQQFLDTNDRKTEPEVHSLGYNPYKPGRAVTMVATATFRHPPGQYSTGFKKVAFRNAVIPISLTFDKDFSGFTPLNDVKDDENHQIEYETLQSHQ